jgi:hypothetical protein
VLLGSSITVTIGAGGSGTSGSSAPGDGTNSVFGSQIAIGGGKGGNNGLAGGNGGSGGGAGSGLSGGRGTVNQGFAGGQTFVAGGGNATSGGGGAGGVGQSPFRFNVGGQGGNGLGSVITGIMTGYGGGGAGTTGNTGSGYSEPSTAYGGGGSPAAPNGGGGTANTGGGGSGAANYTGGPGGSGIVVISYPDVYAAPVSTTGATVSTSGSGSIALSGTLQSISTPSNSVFAFGTGDFTVEAWVYTNTLSGERGFFQISEVAGGFNTTYNAGMIITIGSSPTINANVGNTNITSGATTIAANTWYHIAVTRASNSVRLFINGALVGGPTTVTANLTGTNAVVGGYFNNNFLWNGNVSNLRVVKGTAVYTSAFTPSTTPLTAISGTSLLMNTVSGAQLVDGSSNSITLTPISGSTAPTWNALSPFSVTGYKNRVYRWTSSGSITF